MNTTEKFNSRVAKSDGCWEWTGGAFANGYGAFYVRGRGTLYAHRVAMELSGIEIPSGANVDHICYNRKCVNPEHLRVCTPSQNRQNTVLRSNNACGLKGVSWDNHGNNWRAVIKVDGKQVHLGKFPSKEAAHAAYCAAAAKHFGEFANFG